MKVYDKISEDFSKTRRKPWGEFLFFDKYIKKNQKILDIGCGSGRLFDFLEDKEIYYTGCDISSKLLNIAQKNYPKQKFVMGDFRDLPFGDSEFDLIIAVASFHHLLDKEDQKKGASEMHRILKKNGVICITVWNLFQKKYKKLFFKNIYRRIKEGIFPFGIFVPFGKEKHLRPYYAFTKKRLQSLFSEKFEILEIFYTNGVKKTNFNSARNICLFIKKK